ncbi:MAG: DUF1206 domain-containing protein [Acidimicrobiales bacterium]
MSRRGSSLRASLAKHHDNGAAEGEQAITFLGRFGLAGRTGFYLILTALTVRVALLGGSSGRQADANGALAIVSRPVVGKAAIAAVGLGFVLFGAGRLAGAVKDTSVSRARRAMTLLQGLFYLALSYVPFSFLAGNRQTGSEQQRSHTAATVMAFPGGRELLVVGGLIMIAICGQQIRGALAQDFQNGLDLGKAPRWVRALATSAGVVGIPARALVFLPIGIFLIVSAVQHDPDKAYGTDGELLRLSGSTWGLAVLAAVAAGLAAFVVFSAIESRYRRVISAR